jgi:hypothetical protein
MTRFAVLSLILLTACAQQSATRVESLPPVAQPPAAKTEKVANARTEPVFYNGKTYQLSFGKGKGGYAMRVAGMSAGQKKDAIAVATSSLRYFACKDGQDSKVTSGPNYQGGIWAMSAACV